ncbi:MAG: hypothetical protein CHACPFDD_00866 [Phycisphaerae bacterium]|nr:hypothetical protein [Phycisphaerae bacterium]
MDHVLHEAPADFKRNGGLIMRCPVCPAKPPVLADAEQARLRRIATLAKLFGDDVDGLAVTLADGDML